MKRYSHQHIKALLDKFMDGQTTLEEEALLGDYFRTHDVPAEWEDYRVMFGYFDNGMRQPVTHHRTQRGWWWTGVAAAAVGALVVGLTVANRQPATTRPKSAELPAIAAIDTTAAIDTMAGVETRDLASLQAKPVVTFETPHLASRANHKRSQAARHRRLEAENKRLAKENERLQRELEDLKRRAFIIDMEAMGYKAVQDEDGNIVFIDLNQEIENEFNNQPTNNIPAL
jgi:hypothetical protein